jgi:polysaccharide biosynthesis protein PslH
MPEVPLPRVMTLLTFDPWPVRSGITRRLDAIVRALDTATVQTVVVCDQPSTATETPTRRPVHRLDRDPSRVRSLREVLRGVPRMRPITAAFYVRAELRQAIARLIREINPDVVVTHGIGGAELLRGLIDPGRVVLDADTIDPLTYERIAADTRGWKRWQWALDARLLSRWHGELLPRLGGVTVVGDHDVATYRRLAPGASLTHVPNGASVPRADVRGSRSGALLFLGTMNYLPNRSGLQWFVNEVLPLLPGVELVVVGEGEVPAHPRVRARGHVPELDEVWRSSSALIVPLRAGGGSRLKVIEAMAERGGARCIDSHRCGGPGRDAGRGLSRR